MKLISNHKFFILFFLLTISGISQVKSEVITLWENEIPGAIDSKEYKEETEIKGGLVEFYSKVSVPTLTVFKPEKPNGTAVVICPGGAYLRLYMIGEGYKIAKWLNSLGITAFILKYRLPSDFIMKDKTIGPLQDAQEAIRYIRRNAAKWEINRNKVGVIGFSAGGHLASTLSTHYDDMVYKVADTISAKPNFSILVYPVISMDENITHKGSRTNLLGVAPSQELIEKYSNEKHVNAATPPTYMVHAFDDTSVVIENSIEYFLALRKNKVPSEMHFCQTGKHGFGMGRPNTTSQNWTKQCEEWLKFNQFITSENPTKN
jgi:acetyl esterase/lipase